MNIGSFKVGRGNVFIIAEIGGNHEGNFETAKSMVTAAASAGANAVKFQIFQTDKLVSAHSKIPAYSGASHEQQAARFKKMEFTPTQYGELKKLADQSKVVFMASVFDRESLDKVDSLLPAYKVASGDMTYYSLLKEMRKRRKPLLISTGAATLKEIEALVKTLGRKDLALLHCVCAYPAPHQEMNLQTIPFLEKKFGIPIGFSDHSLGIEACVAATALGAVILEKHFTLDPTIAIGDHKHSMTPEMLAKLVSSVRIIEKSLGQPRKHFFASEERARKLVRRSLYANRDLKPGERLKLTDFTALRPLEGIPAEEEAKWIGRKVTRNLKAGEALQKHHFSAA